MKLLLPLLLLSAATTTHCFQVQPLRSVGCVSNPRFVLTHKASSVTVSLRSVANESIQDDNDDYDVDGSISSWSRLVSSLPRLSRNGSPDELDTKILST
eukprot:scaffold27237_cov140-Skeletonema_dohrnii-CCMP3373.AAC.3